MKRLIIIGTALLVAACGQISPERAADRCEERARAAQGPQVGLTMGVNSSSGGFVGGGISISSDAILGRDPLEVYESCVIDLTGQPPIRPVRLRDI
ncbi:MAG: hypothetical protein ACSHW1_11885 [Yoonia sp.]|uniref:hypothetical protein n=1 Tax=Yoonia sp. TaxID=2212373 RepID=UPI003EFB2812